MLSRTVWLVGGGASLDRVDSALVERGCRTERIAADDVDAWIGKVRTSTVPLMPNLIVLDSAVTARDGVAPLSTLSKRAPWRLVPLVVVSPTEDEAACRDAYAAGASSWAVVEPHAGDNVPAAFARYWIETAMLPTPAAPG